MLRSKRRTMLLADDAAPSEAAILDCALGLFVRDGLCETTVRDIAEASGYTNPALYKFFASKDALALHLFERCYRHLADELGRATDGDATFDRKLDAVLAAFVGLLEDNLEVMIYANETLRRFWRKLPAASRPRSLIGILRELIGQGQAEGVLRGELDVSITVAMMLGTFAQVARMAYFDEVARPYAHLLPSLRIMMEGARC